MACVLSIDGGSSSIRFAVYEAGEAQQRRLSGRIDRIGVSGTDMVVGDPTGGSQAARRLDAADHRAAVGVLLDRLEAQPAFASVEAVGHRVVHGMKHSRPERVTPKLLAELRRTTPYFPEHLPREIGLIEASSRRHPGLTQVACFDPAAANGRVILAHLGNGASLVAVLQRMVNHESELQGVPGTSPDIRDLFGREEGDVRARICDGLQFLGIELEQKRSEADADVISAKAVRVCVRVIRTDEERMIARAVSRLLDLG